MKFMNSFLNTLADNGITVDVENLESLIPCLTYKAIKNMNVEERLELSKVASSKLDSINLDDPEWDMWYGIEVDLDAVREYEDIDELHEYSKKMGTPEFDYDFYSDWYKDVYGIRPRW